MSWFNQNIQGNRPICIINVTNSLTNTTKQYKALIDTGATSTRISKKVKDELTLQSIGVTTISSASNKNYQVEYTKAYILVPINNQNPGMIFDKLTILDSLSSQGIEALIGMDLIQKGVLIIQGNIYALAF